MDIVSLLCVSIYMFQEQQIQGCGSDVVPHFSIVLMFLSQTLKKYNNLMQILNSN